MRILVIEDEKKTAAFLACAKLVSLSILRGTRLARTLRSCGYPLFQCKGTAFYYAPANQYVDLVRSGPKPTRGEVIDVLAVAYAEVRSLVGDVVLLALFFRAH